MLFVEAKNFDKSASAAAANQFAIAFRYELYLHQSFVPVGYAQYSVAAVRPDVTLNYRAHKSPS